MIGQMRNSNIRRIEILRELGDVPSERLEEIDNFLKSILSETPKKKVKEPVSLKGIWKNKGFEKVVDLENEIRSSRKEMGNQLMKRKF
jgi:hypothetical protein